jgi:1-acyl-sn-glycerol-3-phosphate acyltransferase
MNKLSYYLYQPYKWLVYIPLVGFATIALGILAILLSFINKRLSSQVAGVAWARFNGMLVPVHVKVRGKKNINKRQSYVIVANHQSLFDIFIMYGWLGIDIRWVMKYELLKMPVLGIACKRVGHIFVNRSNTKASLESIHQAKKDIVNGTSVIFFPEGTRSKSSQLGKFKKGAFKLAFDLQLPILPVTINGTGKIIPTGTMNLKPGTAKMIIHPPIDITKYRKEEDLEKLIEDAKNVIANGLEPSPLKV